MNDTPLRTDADSAGFHPSEESLIDYLLGSTSSSISSQIEAWVAADSQHADQLIRLSEVILVASETLAQESRREAAAVTLSDDLATRSNRRYLTWFAVAASIAAVVFSFRDFNVSPSAETRVAMAWADAAQTSPTADTVSQLPAWLFDEAVALEPNGSSDSFPAIDSSDGDESTPTFGFASADPPEWLLAAVSDMEFDGGDGADREVAQ